MRVNVRTTCFVSSIKDSKGNLRNLVRVIIGVKVYVLCSAMMAVDFEVILLTIRAEFQVS